VETTNLHSFRLRLREERKRLGLTQAEMAQRGQVRPQSQTLYETGKQAPGLAYFLSLAATGIDVCFLLTGERASGERLSAEENSLIDCARDLSAEDRHALMKMAIAMSNLYGTRGKKIPLLNPGLLTDDETVKNQL